MQSCSRGTLQVRHTAHLVCLDVQQSFILYTVNHTVYDNSETFVELMASDLQPNF